MNRSETQEIKRLKSVFAIERMDKSDILIFEENDGKLRDEGLIFVISEDGTYQIYIDERNEKSEFCHFEELADAMNYYFWWFYSIGPKLISYMSLYKIEHKDIDVPVNTSVEEDLDILQSELERHKVPVTSYQVVIDEITPDSTNGWIIRVLDDGKIKIYIHDRGRLSRVCVFDRSFDACNFFFWTLTGAETHRDIYARHHPDEHRASDVT